MDIVRKNNFKFVFYPNTCIACGGKCCNGSSGYIWIKKKEIQNISEFLEISTEKVINQYLEKIDFKFTIREIQSGNNFGCIFFNQEQKKCSIYSVRPNQCSSFPFWDEYIRDPESAAIECPGVKLDNE